MPADQLPNRQRTSDHHMQTIATHPRRLTPDKQRQLDALPRRFPGHHITRGTPERGQAAYTLAFDGTPEQSSKEAAEAFRAICGSPAGRRPVALADALTERETVRMTRAQHEKYARLGGDKWFRAALDAAPDPTR